MSESIFSSSPDNLLGLVRWHAERTPDREPFHYGVSAADSRVLSYGELDQRAKQIAVRLVEEGCSGERVVVYFSTGPDFLCAYWGCLYAGAIAIPTKVTHPRREPIQLRAIVENAKPACLLGTADTLESLRAHGFESQRCLDVGHLDNVDPERWQCPATTRDFPAMLQYTSGSTSVPRGVIVTHGNLLANIRAIAQCFEISDQTRAVTWLPHYHDMGLIGGLLVPMSIGVTSRVLSPMDFLSRPINWLRAMTEMKATVTGAPNFAYDLCTRAIDDDDLASLDLSNWQLGFNGAEPISADVIDRFCERFATCGFRRETFYPCYGLAEGTLMAAGAKRGQGPIIAKFDEPQLRAGKVQPGNNGSSQQLVSSGQCIPDQNLKIVDPETCQPCATGDVGEIWISGPCVAAGYWQSVEATDQTFGGRLNSDGRQYLRTGDLGFLHEGQLFVTGRAKDVIIIRGQNHYPQDLETTVGDCHPALLPGAGAAFAITTDSEQLAIVYEVRREFRSADANEIEGAIREAISQNHDLQIEHIQLLRPGQLPRTTSGKVQRNVCREKLLDGSFKTVGRAFQPVDSTETGKSDRPTEEQPLIVWLRGAIAERTKSAETTIDIDQNFAHFGLDSVAIVSIAGKLEEKLNRQLSPTILYEFTTIRTLAAHLAGKSELATVAPTTTATLNEPIAIVGMAGRFPKAESIEAYWELLRDGIDAVVPAPDRDWINDAESKFPGGFLDGIDLFDAEFFGISPREAMAMDPQQRILLETAADVFANAGVEISAVRGKSAGVFVGISNIDYERLAYRNAQDDFLLSTGNANSIAANRLSYHFDLRGPSLAIDTACSSSLVAVHHACQSLRLGECEMALAGGVNLILSQYVTKLLDRGRMLSPNGQCRAFDKDANGYVRGEGAGLILLKPLAKAMADGDSIWAVIHGSAVNQDGRANGLTAPNPQSQRTVIQSAQASAGVAPHEIQYIEAHGTGTALGDPIEARVLGEVTRNGRPTDQPCTIGSVKTNIGHLESAAGIAGLIKVVLMMDRQEIPRSLHFDDCNPLIPLDELQLQVSTDRTTWTGPRVAGVSSFGFGGTNSHVVLRAAPEEASRTNRPVREVDAHHWNRKRYWLATQDAPVVKKQVVVEKPKPQQSALSTKQDVIDYLSKQVVEVLAWDDAMSGMIDRERPLPELGVDSVMAMELAFAVEEDLQIEVPLAELAAGPTILDLADRLHAELGERELSDGTSCEVGEPQEGRDRSPILQDLPLSDVQRRLWFLGELAPETGVLNIPVILDIRGPFDLSTAQQALGQLVQNHASLRTTFHTTDEQIAQTISDAAPVAIRLVDLRAIESHDERIASEINQTARERFDPTIAPMMRATLLQLEDEHHKLAVTISHLVSDGWSMGVLCSEFVEAYEAISQGHIVHRDDSKPQFASLVHDSLGEDSPPTVDDKIEPAVLELPFDHPVPAMPKFVGDRCEFELPTELTGSLLELSRELGVTPFMTLLGGLQTLLFRYTSENDITIGVPFYGRGQGGSRNVVGPLMNPLPIRVELSPDERFAELINRTREVVVESQQQQDRNALVSKSSDQSIGRPRPFQVMFDMQDGVPQLETSNLVIVPHEGDNGAAMVDLTFSLRRIGDKIAGHVQFDTELFEAATVKKIIGHYLALLDNLIKSQQPLARVSLLSEDEKEKTLIDWNATHVEYMDQRVEKMFAQRVEQQPDAIALICDDERLTYRQLDERSTAVANMLVARGIQRGDLVGILLDRSLDVAIALMGVIKAGAAYVPVDPTYPPARQQLVLDDAQVRCVISSRANADRVPENIWQVSLNSALLDEPTVGRALLPVESPVTGKSARTTDDLAYVLYTSGSTGKPKGVMVTHRNLANFFVGMDALQDSDTPGVWLAVTSISFDISVFELLWTLSRGYTIVILTNPLAAAIDHSENSIARQIERHGVTHFQCTPPLMRMLMDDESARRAMSTVQKIFIGGDAMPDDLAHELTEHMTGDVYNMYGPTETTIWSSTEKLVLGNDVTIGRPIANTQLYVVDRNIEPLPIGIAGELLIGGDGVTRGYYNKPDLTRDRFIDNPFRTSDQDPQQPDYLTKLYRTGDLVRTLDDGRIEFLGRIDHQTKIRGHRIELGDIETSIQSHPLVKEAVVVVNGDTEQDKRLVAYVVPSNGQIESGSLQNYLRGELPPYMVPSSVVSVEQLALTPNGKIDRKALAAMSPTQPPESKADQRIHPSGDLSTQLSDLIADELALSTVDMNASLMDLGVSSMEIARIANRMEQDLGWRPSFADFFRAGTIAGLIEASPLYDGTPIPSSANISAVDTTGSESHRTEDDFEEGVI